MPQILKTDVRARITEAGALAFAHKGYRAAKMADIAAQAGVSTGNVYRYFPGKEALFHQVIDDGFVKRFDALLDRRVRALANVDHGGSLDDAKRAADEMLRFWIEHRLRVVVLLDRAEGSAHEGFGAQFVDRLVELTCDHLRRLNRGRPLPQVVPFTLENIFHTSRRAIVAILEHHEDPTDIRTAFEAFWSFQVTGLAGFEEWVLQ